MRQSSRAPRLRVGRVDGKPVRLLWPALVDDTVWLDAGQGWLARDIRQAAQELRTLSMPQREETERNWSRNLRWRIASDDDDAEGLIEESTGANWTGLALNGSSLVASTDGMRLYVGSHHHLWELQRGTSPIVRKLAELPASIQDLCLTPAGIAVIAGTALFGVNPRTAGVARISDFSSVGQALTVAADHKGQLTLVFADATSEANRTALAILSMRADASGQTVESVLVG